MLALPALGALGCQRPKPKPYTGRFVADGRERGHLLRDGRFPDESKAIEHQHEVLVLGAGIAGLVAADALKRGGVRDLRLLELEDQAGGTSIGGQSELTGYPWAAHYLPAPSLRQPKLVAFLDRIGLIEGYQASGEPIYKERYLCAMPQERVFHAKRWQEGLWPVLSAYQEDREAFARFQKRTEAYIALRGEDGRRAFDLPIRQSADTAALRALDAMSFEDWAKRERVWSPLMAWYLSYSSLDDFGSLPSQLSAYYGLHYYAARTEKPGDRSAPFLTWPEGNYWLVKKLLQALGPGELQLGQVVFRIQPKPGEVEVLSLSAKDGRLHRWTAKRVLFALPSFLRAHLFDDAYPYRPTYGAWLTANLHLRGRPRARGFELAWDNVLVSSNSLGYVVATHQEGSSYGPTVWTYYRALPDATARAQLEAMSWEEAAESVVKELEIPHPDLRHHLERVDLMKLGHGMVRPAPGMAFSEARRAAAKPQGRLYFAHTDLSGMALFEEAFDHGLRAASEILRDRSHAV